jgi:hypothetical protein
MLTPTSWQCLNDERYDAADAYGALEAACLEGASSVAVFAAMDESYQGGNIAAVGGYVATKKKWFKLIDEWMEIAQEQAVGIA